MDTFLVIFGRTPQLSLLELETVIARQKLPVELTPLTEELELLKAGTLDAKALVSVLGGTVKIARQIASVSESEIAETIAGFLAQSDGPLKYALSSPNPKLSLQSLAGQVKSLLKQKGRSASFRVLKHHLESAGIVSDYTEFVLLSKQTEITIFVTQAVQNIDHWNKKDYGRPAVDPKSGMMPPKVARMLVNLALPQPLNASTWVYDPFCGSGTLLLEALDLGVNAVGTDSSQEAVVDAQKNCQWFANSFPTPGTFTVIQKDAVHVSPEDIGQPVTGIAFEGYLGPPNPRPEKLKDYHKGLKKLYIGVLKRLHPLLAPEGRLVCALPRYEVGGQVISFDQFMDTAGKYGYQLVKPPAVYGRPQAQVKRSIYVLQKLAE